MWCSRVGGLWCNGWQVELGPGASIQREPCVHMYPGGTTRRHALVQAIPRIRGLRGHSREACGDSESLLTYRRQRANRCPLFGLRPLRCEGLRASRAIVYARSCYFRAAKQTRVFLRTRHCRPPPTTGTLQRSHVGVVVVELFGARRNRRQSLPHVVDDLLVRFRPRLVLHNHEECILSRCARNPQFRSDGNPQFRKQ